jgi:predicted AlkP superfamily pyrophosphatase or phosphodiesterase
LEYLQGVLLGAFAVPGIDLRDPQPDGQMKQLRSSLVATQAILLTFALSACATSAIRTAPGDQESRVDSVGPQVILISLDGFRRSYLDTDSLPTLHELAREGVKADAMIPSFPSLTFPNHYTIVTGLYPEHHGIVGNSIYDPDFRQLFTMSNAAAKESRWWLGQPIWVTAEKQGKHAASMFWPGSEVEINSVRPTRWKPYDGKVTFDARVDTVLSWLDLKGQQRLSFITLYFDEPDHSGHEYGPDSPRTAAAAARADSAVGRLMNGLRERGLYDRVNVIVVSDHGMSQLSPDRVVYLDDVVDTTSIQITSLSPDLSITPRDGDAPALLARIRRLPHVSAWLRADVPERLHYNEGRRITPVVAVADDGWTISTHGSTHAMLGGAHGYDNASSSMHALFIAHGPAFRQGVTMQEFPNVDVYDLLANILQLRPAPNDGSLAPFSAVLR